MDKLYNCTCLSFHSFSFKWGWGRVWWVGGCANPLIPMWMCQWKGIQSNNNWRGSRNCTMRVRGGARKQVGMKLHLDLCL